MNISHSSSVIVNVHNQVAFKYKQICYTLTRAAKYNISLKERQSEMFFTQFIQNMNMYLSVVFEGFCIQLNNNAVISDKHCIILLECFDSNNKSKESCWRLIVQYRILSQKFSNNVNMRKSLVFLFSINPKMSSI